MPTLRRECGHSGCLAVCGVNVSSCLALGDVALARLFVFFFMLYVLCWTSECFFVLFFVAAAVEGGRYTRVRPLEYHSCGVTSSRNKLGYAFEPQQATLEMSR